MMRSAAIVPVAAQPDNPVLWNDQGAVLALRLKDDEADEAFRTALSLAPTFAEPYAHLAALRVRQGFAREAVARRPEQGREAAQYDKPSQHLHDDQGASCLAA